MITSPGWFVIPFLILFLCISGFFTLKALKNVFHFIGIFKRAKIEEASIPFSIKKNAMSAVLFWSAFAIGSCWGTWLFLSDTVLTFNQIVLKKEGVVLKYKFQRNEIEIMWPKISKVKLINCGNTTATVEIVGSDGRHWQSARTEIDTLNEALAEIKSKRQP